MGIPSYFKRITESIRGILQPSCSGVSCLALDFNCIIYGCLRSDKLPPYSHETEVEWERVLLEEVCAAVVQIWTAAGKPRTVFLGVDGVVPMAKIRQQRMRRFKSIWLAGKEVEMGVRKVGEERWDTNSITPGTAFMERLGSRLKQLCSSRGWILSDSNEPGEGEHKVMAFLREHTGEGTVVIYGLDADLILLSMLTSIGKKQPFFLMREKGEFQIKGGGFGDVPFLYLSCSALLDALHKQYGKGKDIAAFILDYVAVMSLLGNDFLPHSLTLKIKDGGHDRLMELMSAERYITVDGGPIWSEFKKLFATLAADEETALMDSIYKKKRMSPMKARSEAEALMMPVQCLPLEWMEENRFLESGRLSPRWREIYDLPSEAVGEYLYGLQWIIRYYQGKPVNLHWFYPWHLAPLWETAAAAVVVAPVEVAAQGQIKPQEQLAMVLPLESWYLLRDPLLRTLPSKMPQFWPHSFGFVSLGKAWMWECEANIPILCHGRL